MNATTAFILILSAILFIWNTALQINLKQLRKKHESIYDILYRDNDGWLRSDNNINELKEALKILNHKIYTLEEHLGIKIKPTNGFKVVKREDLKIKETK